MVLQFFTKKALDMYTLPPWPIGVERSSIFWRVLYDTSRYGKDLARLFAGFMYYGFWVVLFQLRKKKTGFNNLVYYGANGYKRINIYPRALLCNFIAYL